MADLDLRGPSRIIVTRKAKVAVINAAAYTAIDAAERDAATAWTVNALAPAALAKPVRQAASLQVSADYVFDGLKNGKRKGDPILGAARAHTVKVAPQSDCCTHGCNLQQAAIDSEFRCFGNLKREPASPLVGITRQNPSR